MLRALAVLALCAAVVHAALPLAPQEFHAVLDPLPVAFVMVFAPWCGHCVASKPAFEAVNASGVPTYMLDASTPEAGAVRAEIGIRGFPTFVFLEHGRLTDTYDGGRTTAAFEAYLRERAETVVTEPAAETAAVPEGEPAGETAPETAPATPTLSDGKIEL
jgi:thiol-disulfide isomerase/thioredoxin